MLSGFVYGSPCMVMCAQASPPFRTQWFLTQITWNLAARDMNQICIVPTTSPFASHLWRLLHKSAGAEMEVAAGLRGCLCQRFWKLSVGAQWIEFAGSFVILLQYLRASLLLLHFGHAIHMQNPKIQIYTYMRLHIYLQTHIDTYMNKTKHTWDILLSFCTSFLAQYF